MYNRSLSFVFDWWNDMTLLLLSLLLGIFLYFSYRYSYWKRRGFPYVSENVPLGSLKDFVMMKLSLAKVIEKLYKENAGYDYIGYYSLWTPTLLIRNPDLVKKVLVKDFEYFCNRGMYYNNKNDQLSGHLFALSGMKWKTTRSKLNSTFGNSKVKMVYMAIKACAIELDGYLNQVINEGENIINCKELISKHSINVMANSAIGMESHSLKNESHLYEMSAKVVEPSVIQSLRFGIAMLGKDFAKLINMRLTPKSVENYYLNLTKQIVEDRTNNKIVKNDFMNTLMELWDKNLNYAKDTKSVDDASLTLKDLSAQTFVFVIAACESSASTICFALYELARNPEIQDKLMAEVDAVGPIEEITYEQLVELKYLQMVLNESWRKYPPVGFLLRECQRDYTLPDGRVVEKGTTLTISTDGLQKDPEYFPEPEKFDPERFNKEFPTHKIEPYTFLPFGEGQRSCIGKRFGQIHTMLTLFTLISKYKFEISEETQIPPKVDPKVSVNQPEGGMRLKVIRRECAVQN